MQKIFFIFILISLNALADQHTLCRQWLSNGNSESFLDLTINPDENTFTVQRNTNEGPKSFGSKMTSLICDRLTNSLKICAVDHLNQKTIFKLKAHGKSLVQTGTLDYLSTDGLSLHSEKWECSLVELSKLCQDLKTEN